MPWVSAVIFIVIGVCPNEKLTIGNSLVSPFLDYSKLHSAYYPNLGPGLFKRDSIKAIAYWYSSFHTVTMNRLIKAQTKKGYKRSWPTYSKPRQLLLLRT